MQYREGYKYQVAEDWECNLDIPQGDIPTRVVEIETDFLWLGVFNKLIVKKGYAWDGPSGPVIRTEAIMVSSLVHDALYQLIRDGYLNKNTHRLAADNILYNICVQYGMSKLRAGIMYYTVRVFGNPAARPENAHKLKEIWLRLSS